MAGDGARVCGRPGGWHPLVTAINEATGEVKYFVTNAIEEPLDRVLAVAFRRATIEHAFRLAKQEAGLMHYEGRQYVGSAAAPDAGVDRAGVRGRAHAAAAGGKTRR